MHLRKLVLAAAMTVAATASAQEAPRVSDIPSTPQGRSASVQHWAVMADDIAKQVHAQVGTSSPVYVAMSDRASAFELGLREFLVSSLHAKGLKVSAYPSANALNVEVATQVATHRSAAGTQLPGSTVMLATGLLVLREVVLDSWKAGLLLGAVQRDVGKQLFKPDPAGRTEVAVSTSVVAQGLYRMRKTDVYYIDAADASVYSSTGKNIVIKGE